MLTERLIGVPENAATLGDGLILPPDARRAEEGDPVFGQRL